ncbi:MAG TPA: Sir2 family NAD-dependent protein deacetylase, partial [Polyangiales bacterium]|nr:Sir2 family NAD-dependent protein deacetylase [Polyangiales bacterium]
ERAIEHAAHLLSVAHNVVALTGAGISTDSGIPDFRGPQGVWTKQPSAERMATLQHYMADPDVRKQSWQTRLHHPIWLAQPNPAHLALVDLERTGRLHTLVTQNVDGLHQRAGSSRERIVEVHGTVHEVVCMRCGDRGSMLPVLERVRAGEADPECRKCGGILKSATISFGQALVPEDLERAEDAARACDLLLAVGSTLSVYPVAAMVPTAKRSGARIVILNGSPTEMDELADVVVNGPLGITLPRVLARLAAN